MSLIGKNPEVLSPSPVENSNVGPMLVLVGVNHTTAPLDIRERLAIPATRLAEATRTLAHQPGVREALILSTCNRVELLTTHDPAVPLQPANLAGSPDLLRFLHEYFAIPAAVIQPHLYEFREREAVRHLFRVACSLDSLVVGEAQILGQVKESYSVAREVGAVSTTLDPLLQKAFSVAKRVRTETEIGASSVSIASVAVDLARKIFGTLRGKQILIVGAGKMAELAARHLIEHGATSLLISNRTESRARDVADRLASQFSRTPISTTILPFDQLNDHAHRADILITSTGLGAQTGDQPGAPGKLITPAQARAFLDRRRNRPVFFIDIAVPRDVDPAVNALEGCFVYDIDDLQQAASSNLASRSKEAAAAETIVADEVDQYQQRLSAKPFIEAIKTLQLSAETLRRQELARSAARLATLTPAQREAVEALTRSLTAKLLHPQIAQLRSGIQPSENDQRSSLTPPPPVRIE